MNTGDSMKIENTRLKIEFNPQLGGKIISFYDKEREFEFAAQKGRTLKKILPADDFSAYAFGMDDAFPNIDQELVKWEGRNIFYPDHGEIWKAEFQVKSRTISSVSLCWESVSLGYQYHKQMSVIDNSLYIQYCIKNLTDDNLPCIWTWHGLMRYEEDMEIIFPAETFYFRNVLEGSVLGNEGKIYPSENTVYDFAKVPKEDSKSMIKFYAEGRVTEGRCGFYYPSSNVACILEYDKQMLPYLGVWVTAGGLQDDYNCALEPTNGFYDSISKAYKNHALPILKSGENLNITLKITSAVWKNKMGEIKHDI